VTFTKALPERERIASAVAAEWALTRFAGGAVASDHARTALVMGDLAPDLSMALAKEGWGVTRWHRVFSHEQLSGPTPPTGLFDLVALRLPRSRKEAQMLLSWAGNRVAPNGELILYAATDEGIQSSAKHFPESFTPPEVQMIKKRCRVWVSRPLSDSESQPHASSELQPNSRSESQPSPEVEISDSLELGSIDLGAGIQPWVSFPGVFAQGRLDEASALLLGCISTMKIHAKPDSTSLKILDFGAGTGALSAGCLRVFPRASVDMLETDALSLEAARRNVPTANPLHGDSLGFASGPYDLIISNPPFHIGKSESTVVLESLVREAPALLGPGGALVMVVQKRLLTTAALRRSFPSVESLAEDRVFRVWKAHTGLACDPPTVSAKGRKDSS